MVQPTQDIMLSQNITKSIQHEIQIIQQTRSFTELQQNSDGGKHLVTVLKLQCHVAIQPCGSKDLPVAIMWPYGVIFRRSLDVGCPRVVFPEEESDDCWNYDLTRTDAWLQQLSHQRTGQYKNRTNNNDTLLTENSMPYSCDHLLYVVRKMNCKAIVDTWAQFRTNKDVNIRPYLSNL